MKMSKALSRGLFGAALAAGMLGCQKTSMPEGQGEDSSSQPASTLAPAATGQATTPADPAQPSKQ